MKSKLVHFSLVAACAFSLTAVAQTNSSASNLPAAPSAASEPGAGGTKIATINMQDAIAATNEGQRALQALSQKLEPKQTELKSMNDELESLKKQLNTQSDKLNDETRGSLVRQIDQKQKLFERTMQDAREDASTQQQDIMQKILQKLAPVLMKYVKENGYGLLIDTSKPWPDGPIILSDPSTFDITKPVVETYNAQSGVAPPSAAAPKPAAAHPGGAATRPATSTPTHK